MKRWHLALGLCFCLGLCACSARQPSLSQPPQTLESSPAPAAEGHQLSFTFEIEEGQSLELQVQAPDSWTVGNPQQRSLLSDGIHRATFLSLSPLKEDFETYLESTDSQYMQQEGYEAAELWQGGDLEGKCYKINGVHELYGSPQQQFYYVIKLEDYALSLCFVAGPEEDLEAEREIFDQCLSTLSLAESSSAE